MNMLITIHAILDKIEFDILSEDDYIANFEYSNYSYVLIIEFLIIFTVA
jgi:hypothetical protein